MYGATGVGGARRVSWVTVSELQSILSQMEAGDFQAAERLLPLVYDDLRQMAAAKLAQEKPGQTLSAADLFH